MKETWDEHWGKIETLNIEEIIKNDSCYRLLKRLIDLPKSDLSILEVGCGSGIRTLALLKEFQNYFFNATLIDFSAIALAFAKKNANENKIIANFFLADASELPFPCDSFDIVWNGGVNEHFDGEKRQLIFNEMARVCKPGGQVVIIVPNALNLPYRLWKKIMEMQGRWQYGFEKPYSIFELKNKAKNAGIIPTRVGGMKVLGSIFHLVELIPKKIMSKPMNAKETTSSGLLRKIFRRTENILERLVWFIGINIGLKGIKFG